MNNAFGMNIGQIEALSGDLSRAAGEVDQVVTSLTKGVQSAPWVGNDRNRFEQAWRDVHAPALRKASAALTNASQAAQHHANEQRRISGGPA